MRRPRDKGSAALTGFSCDCRTSLGGVLLAVGDRTDTRAGDVVLPSYLLVNLTGRRRLRDGVNVIGRVENLLDERYELATGFASPRACAFAGVEGFR